MGRGARGHMGRCAVLRIPTRNGRVRVILNEFRIQTLDPEVFRSVGIEPTEERVLLVKSVVHFRAAFEPIASAIVEVEGPGLVPQDLSKMPFRHVRRPIFPLDAI